MAGYGYTKVKYSMISITSNTAKGSNHKATPPPQPATTTTQKPH